MRSRARRRTAGLGSAVLAATLLVGCSQFVMSNTARDVIAEDVTVAVAEVVPEATSVEASHSMDGFAYMMNVEVEIDDLDLFTDDLVERSYRAMWEVDRGRSSRFGVYVTYQGRVQYVDMDRRGEWPHLWVVTESDLRERYGR